MKYVCIAILISVSIFAVCEVWAIPQFFTLPDASVEEIMLTKVKGATRDQTILKLQTRAGIVTFEDRINAGESSANYYLAGYRDTGEYFYLIRVIGHETNGYVIVNRITGQSIDLFSTPVFSPDGNRFIDVSLDLEAGYMPNVILIYKKEGGHYALEWKHNFQGMKGPADPVWLNNSEMVFFEVTFDKLPTAPNIKKRPFIIEWQDHKWNIPRPLK